GAGGGRKIVGTGLLLHMTVQGMIRLLCQEGVHAAGHGDQGVSEIPDQRHQHLDFRRVSTLGDTYYHIVLLDGSKIAVDGIGSVHEYGRGSGGIEGGDNFGGNDRTFANSCYNYPTFG